jgi:hypothetical protein
MTDSHVDVLVLSPVQPLNRSSTFRPSTSPVSEAYGATDSSAARIILENFALPSHQRTR